MMGTKNDAQKRESVRAWLKDPSFGSCCFAAPTKCAQNNTKKYVQPLLLILKKNSPKKIPYRRKGFLYYDF